MSQNVYIYRTLQFKKGGGPTDKVIFDTDDSATILYIRPGTDDTGSIYFGDGTKDMDVRFTLGTASDYISMDVGAKQLIMGGTAVVINTGDTNIVTGTTTGTKIATATAQKLSFWAATPVVRPGAIIQTYATASGTMSTATIASLTNSAGGTIVATISALGTAATAQPPQAWNDAITTLVDQHNKMVTDVANLKQVVTQVIDNGQTIGIWG